ncbi:hypothetical protein PWG71_06930 [Nocardiopsis sp. N85]|uniref:hypothetical protein n=1 Tax=Nocardiopsis sp. N85 TaxID=3029400 RepID=UPI00237FA22D|nr:hypothetical protein [Nocardiopsis sp. N85]MDE3721117.1 hypothetical protein [Nocardiopsis sp. N85]
MTRAGTLRTAALAVALALPMALAAPAAAQTRGETAADTTSAEERGALSVRHYYTTWRDARSYWSQDTRYTTGGWLWAGRHYFFCQTEGTAHSDGKGANSTWWVLTDDDTGNRDVFVSATALRVAEPWKPIEGLPRC